MFERLSTYVVNMAKVDKEVKTHNQNMLQKSVHSTLCNWIAISDTDEYKKTYLNCFCVSWLSAIPPAAL